jgi:tRNA dimethylallyltransferase
MATLVSQGPGTLAAPLLQSRVRQPPRGPVLVGPTAGGKSALAVDVALTLARDRKVFAEIVTADSIQVYRGLDIGSAKPTPAEQRGIPHHLIDIIGPTETFTVADWLARARATIADIRARNRLPIVVGGTHLYVKALLDGLFGGPDPDPALREELRQMNPGARRAELERVDPSAAARIHRNDERRTVRALEVHRLTGRPISEHQTQWDRATSSDFVLVGLDWPADILARRINARVTDMMARGLLDETRALHGAGCLGPTAREALGYKQLIPFLEGRITLEDAVEQIKIETRRFAKNQRTWLRRLRTTPGSLWIDVAAIPAAEWSGRVIAQILPGDPGT